VLACAMSQCKLISMKRLSIALAYLSVSIAAVAQVPPKPDDTSVSMACALAINATIEDRQQNLNVDLAERFRGMKCIEMQEKKIIVWVQHIDPMARGGGYLYEIERQTQRVLARNPQR